MSLFGASAEEDPLPGVTRSVREIVLAGNVLYGFRPRESVSPYFLVGAGIGSVEFEAIGLSDSEFALGIHGGAGCRFRFGESRRSAIRVELLLGVMQGVSWSTDTDEGYVRSASVGIGFEHVLGEPGRTPTAPPGGRR